MYHNKHSYEQVAIAARPCSAPIQLASCTTTYQIGIAICPSLKLDASGVGSYCLPGFTFSFFFRIPPFAGNEISAEISPKFANSERKGTSNSKNEIPMNSDRIFGDFDRNSVIFDWKMMSVVIFLLFPMSNEKLLNTNFVQFFEIYNFCFRNFSFEQWFESYLIISKTTN